MTNKYRQCLNHENNPRLNISKETEMLFYNHLELKLAHSQHESGSSFSLKASSKEYCPANHLIVSRWDQCWILDLHRYEIINLVGWGLYVHGSFLREKKKTNTWSHPWAMAWLHLLLPLQLRFGGSFQLMLIFGFPEHFLLATQIFCHLSLYLTSFCLYNI